MARVREEMFWIVVLLLFVLIGVVAYIVTITPGSPANNPYPWIQFFESDVCSTYKVNSYGEMILTNCDGF
jgi:hypothetical protein